MITNGNKSCFGCCERDFRYRINQTILQNCKTSLGYRRYQYASPILGIDLSVVARVRFTSLHWIHVQTYHVISWCTCKSRAVLMILSNGHRDQLPATFASLHNQTGYLMFSCHDTIEVDVQISHME